MRRPPHLALKALLAASVACATIGLYLVWQAAGPADNAADAAPARLMEQLAMLEGEGFPRVEHSVPLQFPADFHAHPRYRMESWQLTGVLQGEGTPPLGFQVMLLRMAVSPEEPDLESRWATRQVYAAWYSLTDPAGDGLVSGWRLARGALGLAGSGASLPSSQHSSLVRVEDWHLAASDAAEPGDHFVLTVGSEPVRLQLDLTGGSVQTARLTEANDSAAPFRFYRVSSLRAEGVLMQGEQQRSVAGPVSLEHAWGELPLPGGPLATDRVVLFLDDGRELLVMRTRRVDGSGEPSSVALLASEGDSAPVVWSGESVTLTPIGEWRSPDTGVHYPVRWSLVIDGPGLDVELVPESPAQEMTEGLRLWSGPVRVLDTDGRQQGVGMLQLQGYGEP